MERIASMMPVGDRDDATHRGARRAARRWALHADIELIDPIQARGIALNASVGGMRVAVDRPVPEGTLCVLRVNTSPGRGSVEHARVVWARQQPDGWLLGLEFVDPH